MVEPGLSRESRNVAESGAADTDGPDDGPGVCNAVCD